MDKNMKEKYSILIVGNDRKTVKTLQDVLVKDRFIVKDVREGKEALKLVKEKFYNVVLLDLELPDSDGLKVIEKMKALSPNTIVIITTAYASVKSSVESMKRGAYSYIIKPFNIDEVHIIIKNAIENQQLHFENIKLINDLKARTQELDKANKDLQETQNQLIQSNKMAALGQLSAGLAHELNNPIGGILGYAQYILAKVEKKELTMKDFKDCIQSVKYIEKESDRCKTIIDHLLMFSRVEKAEFEPLEVQWIIERTISVVDYQMDTQNIKLKTDFKKMDKISGNRNQLQQVFTNIIMNAIHAMPNGGELKIGTSVGEGEDSGKVLAIFADNGCGIKKEDMDKIFDPFFTTKQNWKGLGLGLSVSYRIVQAHKGEISVESKLGMGTTFTVKFPKLA